jgi:tetratricopeptide (TPR) repeat protein
MAPLYVLSLRLWWRANMAQPSPGRHCILARLCLAMKHRYQVHGKSQDLQKSVTHGQDALDACNLEGIICPFTQRMLAYSLYERHMDLGDPADLHEAARLFETALRDCPMSCSLRPASLIDLGFIYCLQFRLLGIPHDGIEKAISCHTEARQCPGLSYADIHRSLSHLATARWSRYEVTGEVNDVTEAIDLYQEALRLSPPGHIDRSMLLTYYSYALFFKCQEEDTLDDLELAITHLRSALGIQLPASPRRLPTLTALSNALVERHRRQGNAVDLQEAIELGREAVLHCQPQDRHRWAFLANLAFKLSISYRWTGNSLELDEAVQLHRESLEVILDDHPRIPVELGNLASDLLLRFEDSQRAADLEEAILVSRKANAITTQTHPQYVSIIDTLACCLMRRFRHADSESDLEESIALLRRAADTIPPNRPEYTESIVSLVQGLLLRGKHRGILADIQEAISILEAVAPQVTGDRLCMIHSEALGNSYLAKFKHTQAASDFEQAEELIQHRLQLLPVGRRERPNCLFDLAELYLAYSCNPHQHMTTALRCLSESLTDVHLDVRTRLRRGISLLSVVESDYRDIVRHPLHHQQLLDVYCIVVNFLPYLAFYGIDLSSRLETLTIGQSVVSNAATHALMLSKPSEAVEILEQGRAIFWTHILKLRSQFNLVPEEYRQRLLELSRQLNRVSEVEGVSTDPRLAEHAITVRWHQTEEYHRLVEKVRSLPGLERFMLRDQIEHLAGVARDGPVAILVASSTACHAIVLRGPHPDDIYSVSLPMISIQWLTESSSGWRTMTANERLSVATREDRLQVKKDSKPSWQRTLTNMADEILEKLWVNVAEPVVRSLDLQVRGVIALLA